MQTFLIGMLQAIGRRVIVVPDPLAAEPLSDRLFPGPGLIAPDFEQHESVVVVEFGPAVYADPKHGPGFVLLYHSADRRTVIAAAYTSDTRQCLWSLYERSGEALPYRRQLAVFAGRDLAAGILGETQMEQVRSCEQGIQRALLEAHAWVLRRLEKPQVRDRLSFNHGRRHAPRAVIPQEMDHIDQTVFLVKDPSPALPRHDQGGSRIRSQNGNGNPRIVRPHERQRHFRRQHYGKRRAQVKVVEIRATIVHRELFTGGPGDIEVRYVVRRS